MEKLDELLGLIRRGVYPPIAETGEWKKPLPFAKIRMALFTKSAAKKWLHSFNDHLEWIERYIFDKEEVPGVYDFGVQVLSHFKSGYEVLQLKRRLLALTLRHESGEPREISFPHHEILLQMASSWNFARSSLRHRELTPRQLKGIAATALYPEFVDLLQENPSLVQTYFLWLLRDGNSAEVFILFPAISDWIIASGLSERLGTIGYLLRIEEGEVEVKIEGVFESIHHPDRLLYFLGGYVVSLKEVFAQFANKWREVGRFEVFAEGIVNWSTFKMGHWNEFAQRYQQIDFFHETWWRELPVLQVLTKLEAEYRYQVELSGGEWIIAAHATRGYQKVSYENTHAFLQIAIPYEDDCYYIYDFGKYGFQFPSSTWEGIKLFTQTMPGGIMYPDENAYYTHREHGYFPILVTPEVGYRMMGEIRGDIFKGFAGNMVYQIESENCAKWTHEKLESVLEGIQLPNLYRMSLLDTEPGGLISKVFSLIKKFPMHLHAWLITRLHLPLGAWRGVWVEEGKERVWKSLSNHKFYETGEVFLPALLIKYTKEGLIEIEEGEKADRQGWSLLKRYFLYDPKTIKSYEER